MDICFNEVTEGIILVFKYLQLTGSLGKSFLTPLTLMHVLLSFSNILCSSDINSIYFVFSKLLL